MDKAREVLDFFLARRVLNCPAAPLPFDVKEEPLFELALERSRGLEIERLFFDQGIEIPDDYMTWLDIAAHERADLWTREFDEALYDEWSRLLIDNYKSHIPPRFIEMANNVIGELGACIHSRLTGHRSEFWESIFLIYQSGAWPCGWEGDYPEGRLVIFRSEASPMGE